MPGQLLSCCLQAATNSGIRSHHPARHLEQPALHFLELVVVSFLFLHLDLQVLYMALEHKVHNTQEDTLGLEYFFPQQKNNYLN